MNECNVLIISDSTIQLFNNDFQIKQDIIKTTKNNDTLIFNTELNGKSADIFTIYHDYLERETFDEETKSVVKITYNIVLVKKTCK